MKRNIKKWLAVLLAAACTVTAAPSAAFADELILSDDTVAVAEASDDIAAQANNVITTDGYRWSTATEYSIGNQVQGIIWPVKENDWSEEYNERVYWDRQFFKIPNLATTGRYKVTAGSADHDIEVIIVDNDDYMSTSKRRLEWKRDTDKKEPLNETVDLIAGMDYWVIVKSDSVSSSVESLEFNFKMELKDEVKGCNMDSPWVLEFKNNKCSGNGTLFANFRDDGYGYSNIDEDPNDYGQHYYKFHLSTPGRLTIDSKSSDEGVAWSYRNECKFKNFPTTALYWRPAGSGDYKGEHTDYVDLTAGDYYLMVSNTLKDNVDYSFTMTFTEVKVNKGEKTAFDTEVGGSNNTQAEAFPIDINTMYVAQSTEDNHNKDDWYRFKLPSDAPIYVTLATTEVGMVGWSVLMKGTNDLYDGVSLYGDSPIVYAPIGVPDVESKNPNFKETTTVLYGSSADYQAKKPTVFKAGEYWFKLTKSNGMPIDGYGNSIGPTGAYRFKIATSNKGTKAKYASKISVSNPAVTLSGNGVKDITVTVTPKDADDTSVCYTVDKEGIIEIQAADNTLQTEGKTSYTLTAKAYGVVTITFTASGADPNAKKPVSATCVVSVIEGKGNCPTIVKGQKINLADDVYFGKEIDIKNDKFVVNSVTKGIGSVSKGIFTAKKDGEVTIIRQVKVEGSKKPVDKESISFTIEAPKYHKDPAKGKDIKTKDVVKKGIEIEPADMIDFDGATVLPNYYVCNDKKGFVEFDNETGSLKVLKSGTFKVTAYYGADVTKAKSTEKNALKEAIKNAGKIEYTIKAKLPSLKDAKVKPNKAGGKDKTVKLSVSNVPKDITLKAEDWRAVKVLVSDGGTKSVTEEDAGFKLDPQPVKNSYSKCNVTIPADTPSQVFAVIVTVDGVEYESFITVQPLTK